MLVKFQSVLKRALLEAELSSPEASEELDEEESEVLASGGGSGTASAKRQSTSAPLGIAISDPVWSVAGASRTPACPGSIWPGSRTLKEWLRTLLYRAHRGLLST